MGNRISFDVAVERARAWLGALYAPDHYRGLDLGELELDNACVACALLADYLTGEDEPPTGELDSLSRQVADSMAALGWSIPPEAAPAFALKVCGDSERPN
ncbi:hypothetical protein AZOA_25060 [Azoarcus sp. Aa7]|nr:hypothetical protein [Azoarcus sp. Aa7]